ncbi:hypothetical protein HA72_0081 [Metallosphaera sedula]|uniref:KEOPS complex Pcc1-like subunit n=3 Tax=Metallosphaera TaxID=41980 RepID=A4YCV6_METS5|nr:hypothetical protein Msed_0081 [Metallosphaera sedula DSM 5348]AIM26245.1 hypothetical protein HA72_0081 [Metallosphaera sedula]QCO30148.1 hypothetical protein DFR88_06260 [Metallosphaera prunae]BBL46052.1 KEOPS complex Pcc1-like subunit [Metallosphaera sedula]
MITIDISLKPFNSGLRNLIKNSLIIEDIDKEFVSIVDDSILIKCDSVSRCRAIMNSYIFWIYSVLSTLNEVEQDGRKNSS